MAVIVNDPAEGVTVLGDGPARGYEEIAVQELADAVVCPTGAADHAAGLHFLLKSAAAIGASCAEVVGLGAVDPGPNRRVVRMLTYVKLPVFLGGR